MGIKSAIVVNIAKSEAVELRRVAPTGSIDWQKNWQYKTTSSNADEDNQLEEAEEEIAIQRLVL